MVAHELISLIFLGYSEHICNQTKLRYELVTKGIGEPVLSHGI